MSENPYQAPVASPPPLLSPGSPIDPQSALEIRRAHIKHEASVKSIGILYYLGAIALTFFTIGSIGGVITAATGPADVASLAGASAPLIIFIPLTVIQWITAYGIRRLKPWSRIMAIVLSAIGLIGFPIGTLINGYILYLLLCKKGRMIFSPEYKEIIALTPEVKYKTSKVTLVVLAVFILVIIGAVVAIIRQAGS